MAMYVRTGEPVGPIAFDRRVNLYREVAQIPDGYPAELIISPPPLADQRPLLYAPLQVVMYVAMASKDNCGINCAFCYVPNKEYGLMSDETIENTLQYMQENGVARLQILGGEPFHPLLLSRTMQIIKRSVDYPVIQEINLTTNGLFMRNVDFDYLRKKDVFVSISVHGWKSDHDAVVDTKVFDTVIKNLESIDERGLPFSVATVVTTKNIGNLHHLKQYLDTRKNIVSWGLLYPNVDETGEDPIAPGLTAFWQRFSEFNDAHPHYKVNANAPFQYKYVDADLPQSVYELSVASCSTLNNRQIEVLPNGDVFHCGMLFDLPQYQLGNINTGFVLESRFPKRKLIPGECEKHCKYFSVCNGCPAWVAKNNPNTDNRCPYQS